MQAERYQSWHRLEDLNTQSRNLKERSWASCNVSVWRIRKVISITQNVCILILIDAFTYSKRFWPKFYRSNEQLNHGYQTQYIKHKQYILRLIYYIRLQGGFKTVDLSHPGPSLHSYCDYDD